MKKSFLFLFLLFISFSGKPENPWVKRIMKKKLHSDSIAMYKITLSQKNKFDEDSSTYNALLFYSGKSIVGANELFVDFTDFAFSYYKLGDSAFLFDKTAKKYYQSNLNIDSLLYYLNIEIQVDEMGPLLISKQYQPGFMTSNPKIFETTDADCIGLFYKSMPMGSLMSLGFQFNMDEMFAKPCFNYAVIDTINNGFKSLYMKMDTSKVMGNNPISINYNFTKLEIYPKTHDSIRQVIANYKMKYKLSSNEKYYALDDLKNKNITMPADTINSTNITVKSQKYQIPLQTANGDSLRISDYKGKYVLIDFWFTNCPGCMQGIPKVNSIFKKYKNLVVLGINPVDKSLKAINDVVEKREMKYIACKAPKGYEKLFNVPFFPTYILLSPDQKTFETIKLQTEEELNMFMEVLDKKLK